LHLSPWKDAVALLEQVVETVVPKKHLDAFKRVRTIRNQMVHFYHVETSGTDGEKRMRGIVANQLEAWYLLNALLHSWDNVFEPWKARIGALDSELRKHREYLKAAYNELRDGIKEERATGVLYVECPACGFDAERHPAGVEVVYQSECRTCRFTDVCIRIKCPECSAAEVIFRESVAPATCSQCDAEMDRDELVDHFVDSDEAYSAAKDGGHYPFPVNCGLCEGYETVVELPKGELLCTACFDEPKSFATCEWCNDESTHLDEDTFVTGCGFCDGRGMDDD
jgi:hypothetical protein